MAETKEIRDPYGFIYITTNMVNGKKYIGQRVFHRRGWQSYLGSGIAFRRAIDKYGKDNFHRDIVAIAYSKEELDKLEIEFIELHNAVESNNYYNIKTGGACGNPYAGKTEEEMLEIGEKISNSQKGDKHWKWQGGEVKHNCDFCGKEYNIPKLRFKRSKNLFCSKECYANWKRGRQKIEYIKCNCDFCGKEMELPPSDYKRSRKHFCNKECSLKYITGEDCFVKTNGIKIICTTTNEIFNSLEEARKCYNLKSSSGITKCCKGERKSAGKLKDGTRLQWAYYSNCTIKEKRGVA